MQLPLTQERPGQQEVLPPQKDSLQHLPFVQTSPQHSELVVHVPPDDTHGTQVQLELSNF